jgi:hypothetical protein
VLPHSGRLVPLSARELADALAISPGAHGLLSMGLVRSLALNTPSTAGAPSSGSLLRPARYLRVMHLCTSRPEIMILICYGDEGPALKSAFCIYTFLLFSIECTDEILALTRPDGPDGPDESGTRFRQVVRACQGEAEVLMCQLAETVVRERELPVVLPFTDARPMMPPNTAGPLLWAPAARLVADGPAAAPVTPSRKRASGAATASPDPKRARGHNQPPAHAASATSTSAAGTREGPRFKPVFETDVLLGPIARLLYEHPDGVPDSIIHYARPRLKARTLRRPAPTARETLRAA